MSATSASRDRRRTSSLVLSTIALVALTFLLAWAGWIGLTVPGASAMIAIVPMALFWITSWLWGLLALIALGLGAGCTRPVLPVCLAVSALVEIVVGVAVLRTL